MMATLRAAVILTIFLGVTLLLIPVQFAGVKLGLGYAGRLPHCYHRFLARLIGIRIARTGEPVKGGLMAANHTSWLDITVLSAVAPVSFVAKSEVGTWPFFGTLARLQHTVFVRRERARAGEDRNAIRRRLVAGDTLVLFPEGTSSDGNRVLPFKSALFSAAELSLGEDASHCQRHAPVQPVSIAYVGLYAIPMGRENRPFFAWYGDMDLVPHLWQAFRTGPIDVAVTLHPPITVDEAGGRKALARVVEQVVRQGVISALAGAAREPPAPLQDEELTEALAEDDDLGEAA
jgi:lyso-ornithine lipid O-acyltransferase